MTDTGLIVLAVLLSVVAVQFLYAHWLMTKLQNSQSTVRALKQANTDKDNERIALVADITELKAQLDLLKTVAMFSQPRVLTLDEWIDEELRETVN